MRCVQLINIQSCSPLLIQILSAREADVQSASCSVASSAFCPGAFHRLTPLPASPVTCIYHAKSNNRRLYLLWAKIRSTVSRHKCAM